MRIDCLDLAAYGPFTSVTIDLAQNIGLHVVFGPNEAGKSSALRAVGDLFFGVPGQTSDDFVHRYEDLRIRAVISTRDGRSLEFTRRKGRPGSDLLDASGHVLGRDALVPFLGHADRLFFEHAFGLDPGRLAAGAKDLLQSGGDVGRAVLQASSGVSGLSTRLDIIEAAAEFLFKKAGKTQPIAVSLARLKVLEGEVKSSRLSGEDWKKLSDELASARVEAERLIGQRIVVDANQQRLARIRLALPLLARRKASQEPLSGLDGVPLLPDTFEARATSAREEQLRADSAEESLARDAEGLAADLSRLPVPSPLLLRGKEIEAFHQECGNMRSFRRDLPAREGELREATAQATRLAREIAPGLPLDEVLSSPLPRTTRKALRSLAGEARRLKEEQSRSERELASNLDGTRLLKERLAALGPASDPAPLTKAVREVQRGGDPVERLSSAEASVKKSGRALSESLSSLYGWPPRGADQLAALAFPGGATIDGFQKRFAVLDEKERELEAERKRLTSELEAREAERRTLAAGRTLPTRQDVTTARERRTKGWNLVRKVYVEKQPDAGEEARTFDPDRPLVEAFERSVDSADVASDRLVDAADAAASDLELARQLKEIEARLASGTGAADEFASRRAVLETEWRSAWPAEGIAPLTPAEMRDWLRARERVLERLEAHRTTESEADTARQALERARASLATALAAVRPPGITPSALYTEVQSLAEETREILEKQVSDRKRLEAGIDDTTSKLGGLELSVSEAREALEAWKRAWAEGVATLRRPATASTEEVVAVLEACDLLDTESSKVNTLRDRIRKMQDGLKEFSSSVAALCASAAPDLGVNDAIAAAETLFERLGVDRATEGKRDQIANRLDKSRIQLAKEREKVEAARRKVEALCREASCATADDLPSRLGKLGEKRRALQDLEAVERELLAAGGGRAPSDLETECASVDGDSIPGTLEQLTAERGHLDAAIGELRRREGELGKSLEAADGGDSAAERSQEAAGVRARIEQDARQWLRLRASAFLLRYAIESWRRENQDPLLVEAATIFASLTDGRFVSLLAEVDDDGGPAIVAVRAGGKRVPMKGLSDGTRDQLYLALRLASLRRYAMDAEPLPLIADDLLVSFDNARTAAALKVLADFGREVQVILFTHHRHLVDLAKAALPRDTYELHELDAWDHVNKGAVRPATVPTIGSGGPTPLVHG